MSKKLNGTDQWIIAFLEGKDFTGPEQIGKAYGEGIGNPRLHSSWASPKCKKLTLMGILERSDRGNYRLKNNTHKNLN